MSPKYWFHNVRRTQPAPARMALPRPGSVEIEGADAGAGANCKYTEGMGGGMASPLFQINSCFYIIYKERKGLFCPIPQPISNGL